MSDAVSDAVRRGDGFGDGRAEADGSTEAATWRLPLFGGVELSGGPGLLEVSLVAVQAGGGAERIVLRRQWRAGDTEEPEVVVV